MPQLPSGRHIAIQANGFDALYDEAFNGTQAHKLMQIKTIEDLYPYIDVLDFEQDERHAEPGLPAGLKPVPSGHTLATVNQANDWHDEHDKAAFWFYISSERAQSLLEAILDDVKQRQQDLMKEGPYLGRLLALFWHVGAHPLQEQGIAGDDVNYDLVFASAGPEYIQPFVLAAMFRLHQAAKRHPEIAVKHRNAFDRLSGIVHTIVRQNLATLEPWLHETELRSDEMAVAMWREKVLDALPEISRAFLARQMPHEISNMWSILADDDAQEMFPVEHKIVHAAWLATRDMTVTET